jgi:hypothetical protein
MIRSGGKIGCAEATNETAANKSKQRRMPDSVAHPSYN